MDKTENMNFSRAFMDFLGRMQLAIPFGVSVCVVYKFMDYRNFLGITFILSSITIVGLLGSVWVRWGAKLAFDA